MSEFHSGSGSLTLKISDSAKPGNYTVSFYVGDCYTADFQKASCTVSGGGTITVVCEHSFGAYVETKKATCTEPGEETRTCSKCGETETRTVEALGHNLTHHNAKAATCTEAGWNAYDECSRCDYTTRTQDIPALGHNFGEYVETKAATCTEKGVKTSTCSRCGETKTQDIPALGHSFGEYKVTKAATCTEKGEETATCTRCNTEKNTREIAALGHAYGEYVETKAPTCTEKGEKTATCSRCGETTTQDIPALGHSYSKYEVIKAATCTEKGQQTAACDRCGETKVSDVPALGHSGRWITVTEPTATENGYKEFKCTRCGKVLDTQIIPKIGEAGSKKINNLGVKLAETEFETLPSIWMIDLSQTEPVCVPLLFADTYVVGQLVVEVHDGIMTVKVELPESVKIEEIKLKLSATVEGLLDEKEYEFDTEYRIADEFGEADTLYLCFDGVAEIEETMLSSFRTLEDVLSEYQEALDAMTNMLLKE
jgi:hypothetical protein